MAVVYIIYSPSIDSYYVGSCLIFDERLDEHRTHTYSNAFTRRATDWNKFYVIDNLSISCARQLERHIKRMKSRKYFENLKKYPEMTEKLIHKYSTGSSR